jgi:NADH:ubiquinone oxidoreductase subunit F (NADH-binding)
MTNLRDGKVTRDEWETNLLPVVTELGRAIELSSICGLGRSVPVPIVTLINFFPQDLAKHLR